MFTQYHKPYKFSRQLTDNEALRQDAVAKQVEIEFMGNLIKKLHKLDLDDPGVEDLLREELEGSTKGMETAAIEMAEILDQNIEEFEKEHAGQNFVEPSIPITNEVGKELTSDDLVSDQSTANILLEQRKSVLANMLLDHPELKQNLESQVKKYMGATIPHLNNMFLMKKLSDIVSVTEDRKYTISIAEVKTNLMFKYDEMLQSKQDTRLLSNGLDCANKFLAKEDLDSAKTVYDVLEKVMKIQEGVGSGKGIDRFKNREQKAQLKKILGLLGDGKDIGKYDAVQRLLKSSNKPKPTLR